MSRVQPRFLALLRLCEARELAARTAIGEARSLLARIDAAIQAHDAQLAAAGTDVDPRLHDHYARYCRAMEVETRRLQAQRQQAEARLAEAEARWRETYQRLRSVEMLRERDRQRILARQLRRDQRQVDEFAIRSWIQGQRA